MFNFLISEQGPMRRKTEPTRKATFIEEHRRRQLIDTAIETIANEGLHQASLSAIAGRAGVTKGVISYYFKSKHELVERVMADILADIRGFISERVAGSPTPSLKLKNYVSAFFDYAMVNRDRYAAFVELWTVIAWGSNKNPFGSVSYVQCRNYIDTILREGQKKGDFPQLDLNQLSTLIQGMVDGVIIQWLLDPELVNIDVCKKKVLETLDIYLSLSGACLK